MNIIYSNFFVSKYRAKSSVIRIFIYFTSAVIRKCYTLGLLNVQTIRIKMAKHLVFFSFSCMIHDDWVSFGGMTDVASELISPSVWLNHCLARGKITAGLLRLWLIVASKLISFFCSVSNTSFGMRLYTSEGWRYGTTSNLAKARA